MSASERDELARSVWRALRQGANCNPQQLVFVDECGSHLALTPLYSRAPRGQRALGQVPKNRGQNTTIVGAVNWQGVAAAMTLQGAADSAAFVAFIEHCLVEQLQAGQIVIMDNLSIHKNQQVRRLIEAAGCELVFLPTYSPDLNPIELAWSKLKAHLRRVGARTRDALEGAIGAGLNLITAQDTQHWFKHCGYQSL